MWPAVCQTLLCQTWGTRCAWHHVLGTVQYSTVQYVVSSSWHQVLCTQPRPPPWSPFPSHINYSNNVDFEYCVPSTTLGTVPSAWHEIHGTKYSTCVPVVPGVQYARSHVGLDKLHFEPFSLH